MPGTRKCTLNNYHHDYNHAKKTGIKPFLTGALVAGLTGAVLNNLYSYAYSAITGFSIPKSSTWAR
jgi:hypothetical protein